ncbi:hypothetical protein H6F86_10655 [Phormidium sp. FACHB-592]|uniref:CopG family transcriptional regulator n=1 Tax=Stenomitos frigidus AS-A4 TaxID=2933935 RepID=A0ABV0KRL0_9CYAN|nr:hypothetical protein [Phormidium sp. FACHB-592]MBD2074337.1 hypothetical protein [Phormidium sp. FACHB-592]
MSEGLESMAGGKRDDPKYAQVSGFIPKELALQFKATCMLQETTLSEALENAVRLWLAQIQAATPEES